MEQSSTELELFFYKAYSNLQDHEKYKPIEGYYIDTWSDLKRKIENNKLPFIVLVTLRERGII